MSAPAASSPSPLWRVASVALGVVVAGVALVAFRALRRHDVNVPSYTRADYDRAMKELASATDGGPRADALVDAAKTSVWFGPLEQAESQARELLRLAATLPPHWNTGNAIHDGHMVLGLVALRRGDVDGAKRELLEAGNTTGSPQLDSFGPNMSLARELLARGEGATVLAYFELCRRFWKNESGVADLAEWTDDVRDGRTPDFGANLVF